MIVVIKFKKCFKENNVLITTFVTFMTTHYYYTTTYLSNYYFLLLWIMHVIFLTDSALRFSSGDISLNGLSAAPPFQFKHDSSTILFIYSLL